MTERPSQTEYAPFYAGYVALVPETDILAVLEGQIDAIHRLLAPVPAEKESYRYAEGKWSIRQVLGHLVDGERVFAYRALRFGRGDRTPLPGFEQDLWVPECHAASRPWPELLADFAAVRAASLHLFRSFAPADWERRGEACDIEVSVRAIAWILAGHELHHRRIVRERYAVVEVGA